MNKKVVLFALIMSILYVSSIFLSVIISYRSDNLPFVYMVLNALLYGFALVSRKKKECIFKYALSIPFSYIVLQYFWTTDYAFRALNRAFPGYGESSAGGDFAGFVLLVYSSAFCLAGGIISLFIKPKNYETFEKIQLIVTVTFTMLTVVSVFILELQFPSYDYIMSYLNS